MIRYDVARELLDAEEILRRGPYRTLLVHGAFGQERANKFESEFNEAILSGQPIIPILISSYGGSCDQLNRMIDIIETSPVPVATVTKGMCMSCGILLLAAGTEGYRWAAKSTSIMVHDIADANYGKAEDIISDASYLKKYRELIFARLDKQTHKKKGYWLSTLKGKGNTDYFLMPAEAKKLGLIDHIGIPNLTVKVSVKTTFE